MIKLPRVHSFEFHDLNWFPNFLKYQITFILYIFWTFELPQVITQYIPILKHLFVPRYQVVSKPLSDAIAKLVTRFPDDRVIVMDMCSGGSGPNDLISNQVNKNLRGIVKSPVKFYLSDLYPNLKTWAQVCSNNHYLNYISESVNAILPFNFPKEGDKIFQTFYCCFHHFEDGSVRKILKNSLECSNGFAVIETTNRTIFNCIKAMVLNTLFILIIIPFYIHKIPLTMLITLYFIPILLFSFCWDNLISCLRTRSNEELIDIINEFDLVGWELSYGYGYSTWGVDKVNWVIAIKVED